MNVPDVIEVGIGASINVLDVLEFEFERSPNSFICQHCQIPGHGPEGCLGKSWCDCQHDLHRKR